MRPRKISIVALISICTMFFSHALADLASASELLPTIDGWECGEERIVALDSLSGTRGEWHERTYRTPRGTFKAVLMTGNGPKFFRSPAVGTSSDSGDGARYEAVSIDGTELFVEAHPLLGSAVCFRAGTSLVTLESSRFDLSPQDLCEAALRIAAQSR